MANDKKPPQQPPEQQNQPEKPKVPFGKRLFNGVIDIVSFPGKVIDKVNVLDQGSEKLDKMADKADNEDKNVKQGLLKTGSRILGVAGAAAEGMIHGPQAAIKAGVSEGVGAIGREIIGADTSIEKMSDAGYGSKKALKYEFKEFQEQYVKENMQSASLGKAAANLGRSLIGVNDDASVSIKAYKEMKFSGGSMDEFNKFKETAKTSEYYSSAELGDYIEYKKVSREHAGNAKGKISLEEALKKGGDIGIYTENLKNNTLDSYANELHKDVKGSQKDHAESEKILKEDIQKAGGSYREFAELRETGKKSPYAARVDEEEYKDYARDIKTNPGLLKNAKGHISLKEAIGQGGDVASYHDNLKKNTLGEYEQDLKADMQTVDKEKADKQSKRDEAYGTPLKAKKTAEAEPQSAQPETASPIPDAAKQQALAQAQRLGQSNVALTQDQSAAGAPEQNAPTVANRTAPVINSEQGIA